MYLHIYHSISWYRRKSTNGFKKRSTKSKIRKLLLSWHKNIYKLISITVKKCSRNVIYVSTYYNIFIYSWFVLLPEYSQLRQQGGFYAAARFDPDQEGVCDWGGRGRTPGLFCQRVKGSQAVSDWNNLGGNLKFVQNGQDYKCLYGELFSHTITENLKFVDRGYTVPLMVSKEWQVLLLPFSLLASFQMETWSTSSYPR